jgi:hypothetical protein
MSVHTLNGQFDFIIQRPQHESKPQCLVRLGLFPGTPVNPEHAFTNQVMADQTMFCLEASVNATDYWKVRQEMSCSKGPFSCPRNTIQEAWRHWRLATRKVEALVPITESSGALHGPFHTSLTVYLCYCLTAHSLPVHCLSTVTNFLFTSYAVPNNHTNTGVSPCPICPKRPKGTGIGVDACFGEWKAVRPGDGLPGREISPIDHLVLEDEKVVHLIHATH